MREAANGLSIEMELDNDRARQAALLRLPYWTPDEAEISYRDLYVQARWERRLVEQLRQAELGHWPAREGVEGGGDGEC